MILLHDRERRRFNWITNGRWMNISKNGRKCTESERSPICSVSTVGQTLHLPRNRALPLLDIEPIGVPNRLACLFVVPVESAPVACEFVGMDIAVSVHREIIVQAVQFILRRCVLLDGLQINRLVHPCPFGGSATEVV